MINQEANIIKSTMSKEIQKNVITVAKTVVDLCPEINDIAACIKKEMESIKQYGNAFSAAISAGETLLLTFETK
ncbi:hypothetical protein ACTXT7_009857 [Hymenolepis weldensis]